MPTARSIGAEDLRRVGANLRERKQAESERRILEDAIDLVLRGLSPAA